MRAPALVPAVATLVGVVAGLEFGQASPWVALCLVTAWATSLASLAARSPRLALASAGIGFLSAGWIVGTAASNRLTDPSLRDFVAPSATIRPTLHIEGRLMRDAAPTSYGASLTIDLERATRGGVTRPISGGLRVSVGGSYASQRVLRWRAGRRVRLPVQLRRPPRYWNPGTPNQERVLNRRDIALVGSTKSALLVDVVGRGSRIEEAAAAIRASTWLSTRGAANQQTSSSRC